MDASAIKIQPHPQNAITSLVAVSQSTNITNTQIHTVDQILTFTSGTGLAQVAGKEQEVKAGDLVIVPAGTKHQFINTGPTPLILYTVYSPAEHKATTVHKTKEEGDKAEEEGRDEPPDWSQRSKEVNEKEGWVKAEE
jgi:mannose-6-phosphate isomerase-like protein (cupin superfamily)